MSAFILLLLLHVIIGYPFDLLLYHCDEGDKLWPNSDVEFLDTKAFVDDLGDEFYFNFFESILLL